MSTHPAPTPDRPDLSEIEALARLCAQKAEEAHSWASQAWRDHDIAEARACSQQEIDWRRDQLAWEQILRTAGLPTPEPVPPVITRRIGLPNPRPPQPKRAYKPRPKRADWPPTCSVGW